MNVSIGSNKREVENPGFILRDFEPAYLQMYQRGELQDRARLALLELEDCCACPRNCHVNRLLDEKRVCNTGRYAIVSSFFAHFGEEDCLRGWHGSGTIFFGLCNLRCVFCQNWDISQLKSGKEFSAEEIADAMLFLQDRGCHNINFVTPEHVAPQVIEAIAVAVPRGLRIPIVYNTSAYDAISSLQLLDGLVDIYMPDFKFWHKESARRFAKAKDYPERARAPRTALSTSSGGVSLNSDRTGWQSVVYWYGILSCRDRQMKLPLSCNGWPMNYPRIHMSMSWTSTGLITRLVPPINKGNIRISTGGPVQKNYWRPVLRHFTQA